MVLIFYFLHLLTTIIIQWHLQVLDGTSANMNPRGKKPHIMSITKLKRTVNNIKKVAQVSQHYDILFLSHCGSLRILGFFFLI